MSENCWARRALRAHQELVRERGGELMEEPAGEPAKELAEGAGKARGDRDETTKVCRRTCRVGA